MLLRLAMNRKTSKENRPLEIRPTHITVDEKFQMENEKDGGDRKRMKTGNSRGRKRLFLFKLLVIKVVYVKFCSVKFLSLVWCQLFSNI
jgi:hypothetical protein